MPNPGGTPSDRLALEMRKQGLSAQLCKYAREGYWSDTHSPLELPKMDLVRTLEQHNRHGLAQRVREGEFDG